jgi:hypothetical protein
MPRWGGSVYDMGRKPGSKQLILEFFLNNLGKVLESRDIQKAGGGAVE